MKPIAGGKQAVIQSIWLNGSNSGILPMASGSIANDMGRMIHCLTAINLIDKLCASIIRILHARLVCKVNFVPAPPKSQPT